MIFLSLQTDAQMRAAVGLVSSVSYYIRRIFSLLYVGKKWRKENPNSNQRERKKGRGKGRGEKKEKAFTSQAPIMLAIFLG